MMFRNPVAINSEEHSRLRFTPASSLGFAAEVGHIPVMAFELEALAVEFPIVYELQSGQPVALLGVRPGHNAYLGKEQRWRASAIPSALSCYPFGLYSEVEGQHVMIMDESASTLQSNRGKLLYNKQGNGFRPSPLLKELQARLTALEEQRLKTALAFSELRLHGVLVEQEAAFRLQDGEHRVRGFAVLDWERVAQLDESVRQRWDQVGLMGLLRAQTESLKNLRTLHRNALQA